MTARGFVVGFVFGVLPLVASCGAALTNADRAELATDGVRIGTCAAIADQCGDYVRSAAKAAGKTKDQAEEQAARECWPVFDACRDDAGITRDGGKR